MEIKEYLASVLKGVVGSLAVTVILIGILSLVMTFVDISTAVFTGLYVGITSISLVIGTIIAAKLYGRKGWLVGAAVGIVFYIALYLLGIIFGSGTSLDVADLMRFGLGVVVGVLSGMLGINLGSD